ncbi:hypothetical protein ACOZDZ_28400 [Streptomyces griseoincarnatus]|uniref:hypothetical protein n=1 Tax=Streptomyces sp. RK31 TaxID=2824892 RepID=UPI001B39449D|nr:hypothetical protein [Streptomyces sp. RK31]MBQ0971294.1 hypothetical protein [Streptomyces sp. RK31]
MDTPAPLHASPRRGAELCSDSATGEIRVPLSLFCVDEPVGTVNLVLSRPEGEMLLEELRWRLGLAGEVPLQRRPEVAR